MQCVRIQIQGVPMFGIIDSGTDITIIGGQESSSCSQAKEGLQEAGQDSAHI